MGRYPRIQLATSIVRRNDLQARLTAVATLVQVAVSSKVSQPVAVVCYEKLERQFDSRDLPWRTLKIEVE